MAGVEAYSGGLELPFVRHRPMMRVRIVLLPALT
jgi:hypothetical protein